MATVDSVGPSSSASQQVSSAGFDLAKALTALEVFRDAPVGDRVKLAHRVISAFYASVRSEGGSVVSDDSAASGASKGSVGVRVRSVGAGGCGDSARWRKGSATGVARRGERLAAVPGALVSARAVHTTEGYCYLRAFKQQAWPEVKKDLGAYPNFFSMLAQPEGRYVSLEDLDKIGFTQSAGLGHLVDEVGDCSLLNVLTDFAGKVSTPLRPDSFQHSLKLKKADNPVRFSALCKLGAEETISQRVLADVFQARSSGFVTGEWAAAAADVRKPVGYMSVSTVGPVGSVRVCVPLSEFVDVTSFSEELGLPMNSCVVVNTMRCPKFKKATYGDDCEQVVIGFSKECTDTLASSMMDHTDPSVIIAETIATADAGVCLQCQGVELVGKPSSLVVWRQSEDPRW